MKKLFPLIFVILSIVGLADAGYITKNEFAGVVPPCNVSGFNCDAVLTSPWSKIGSIPISVLGLIYYSLVFILASMMTLEINPTLLGKKLAKTLNLPKLHPLNYLSAFDLLLLLTGFGLLFSIYLMILMGIVIKAWCLYCAISAANSLLLFIFTRIYQTNFSSEDKQNTTFLTHYFQAKTIGWLYRTFAKPFFFLFDAEKVHETMTFFGKSLGSNPITSFLTRSTFFFLHPNNQIRVAGIDFPSKVGLAAGYDYHADLTQTLPDLGFGFHTIGTVTLHPYPGNQKPRLGRFPNSKGLLVNKGFKSLGAKTTIEKLTGLIFRIPVGISIGSTNKDFKNSKEQIKDIIQSFKLFEKSKVKHSYYELNISCPNTKGGEPFTTPARLKLLLTALAKLKIKKPVFVKMPIDISDEQALELLKIIRTFKLSGVIFGNLTKDKKNPAVTPSDRMTWKNVAGHISGKPTWKRSNHLIALTKKHYGNELVIIGTGGIFSAEDAQEKLNLGADLVQLITGMIFQGPQLLGEINNLDARNLD